MKKIVLMSLVLLIIAGAMVSAQSMRDRFNKFLDAVETMQEAVTPPPSDPPPRPATPQPTTPKPATPQPTTPQPTTPKPATPQPTTPNTQPAPTQKPVDTKTNTVGKVEKTSGKLNYSGGKIPSKYNGQHIIAAAVDSNSNITLFAAASIANDGAITGARISGGNASLQVWRSINEDLVNFNGSGNFMLITYVLKQAVMTRADWEKAEEAMKANPLKPGSWCIAMDIMGNAAFSSGTGAANSNRFTDF